MTYFLMKWEEDNSSLYAPGRYVLAGSVGTIEEAERWAAQIFRMQRDEIHQPFSIEGKRLDFRFTETITAVSGEIRMPKARKTKRK